MAQQAVFGLQVRENEFVLKVKWRHGKLLFSFEMTLAAFHFLVFTSQGHTRLRMIKLEALSENVGVMAIAARCLCEFLVKLFLVHIGVTSLTKARLFRSILKPRRGFREFRGQQFFRFDVTLHALIFDGSMRPR